MRKEANKCCIVVTTLSLRTVSEQMPVDTLCMVHDYIVIVLVNSGRAIGIDVDCNDANETRKNC